MKSKYPAYVFFPRSKKPPSWIEGLRGAFLKAKKDIDTSSGKRNTSDQVLAILRRHLELIGFRVEQGKKRDQKISRPVLYGEMGIPEVSYEVDAYQEDHGIVLEIGASRSILGNDIYKHIIQMSLMVDTEYAAVAIPRKYSYKVRGREQSSAPYERARALLEAIFASHRLNLPISGFLLLGY